MTYLLEGEETDRLSFRRLQNDDYITWLELFREKQAGVFLGMGHLKTPEECCTTWFEKVQYRYDNHLGGMNALTAKESGRLVGQAGLLVQEVDGAQFLEVGYSILPSYRHKGYATEAAIKCRNYAFSREYAERLLSIIHKENTASMKVAQNNGMSLFKTTVFKEVPVHIFSITYKEWFNKNQAQ